MREVSLSHFHLSFLQKVPSSSMPISAFPKAMFPTIWIWDSSHPPPNTIKTSLYCLAAFQLLLLSPTFPIIAHLTPSLITRRKQAQKQFK